MTRPTSISRRKRQPHRRADQHPRARVALSGGRQDAGSVGNARSPRGSQNGPSTTCATTRPSLRMWRSATPKPARPTSAFPRMTRRPLRIALAYARHAANAGDAKLALSVLKGHFRSDQERRPPDCLGVQEEIEAGGRPGLLITTPVEGMAEAFYGLGEALAAKVASASAPSTSSSPLPDTRIPVCARLIGQRPTKRRSATTRRLLSTIAYQGNAAAAEHRYSARPSTSISWSVSTEAQKLLDQWRSTIPRTSGRSTRWAASCAATSGSVKRPSTIPAPSSSSASPSQNTGRTSTPAAQVRTIEEVAARGSGPAAGPEAQARGGPGAQLPGLLVDRSEPQPEAGASP